MKKIHTTYIALFISLLTLSHSYASEIAPLLTYQGVLELHGQPVNGVKTLRFFLYKNNTEPVWNETHDIPIASGRFSVLLGSKSTSSSQRSINDILNKGWDLYLRIAVVENGQETLLDGSQRITPTPYSIREVVHEVPVGAVIDWWCPKTSTPCKVPPRYQQADGSLISDAESPLYGQHTPNLTGQFVRGATSEDDAAGDITGGSYTHSHQGSLPAHTHTYSMEHKHPSFTGHTHNAGSHSHMILRMDYNYPYVKLMAGNGFEIMDNIKIPYSSNTSIFPTYYNIFRFPDKPNGERSLRTSTEGEHNHSSTIDVPSFTDTKTTEPSTQIPLVLEHEESLPPYVDLLKIVRIK